MKRALFPLLALSMVLVFGCQPKPLEGQPMGTTDCYTAMPGTRPIEITVRSYPTASPPRYEIAGINPESLYLSIKALNKVRWTINNEVGLPVNVTLDSFVNDVNSTERNPFGSDDNSFSVSNVGPGQSQNTAASAPLNGKKGTFKYKITVTFINGAGNIQFVVDPRVVVGD